MRSVLYHKIMGTGQPLVLLHGWGWNSTIWEPLLAELSQCFQLVLIDLPGFGKSPLTISEYSIESIAPLLLEIAPDNAIWLGWSLGGMLAWQMAIHYPDKIKKLITVAASPRFVAGVNWPGVSETALEKFKISVTTQYKKTLTDFLELQLCGKSANQTLFTTLKKQLFASNSTSVGVLLMSLHFLLTVDLREQLFKVQCPSLHIFGSLDRLVSPKIASLIQLLSKGKSEIISGSAHMPFLTHKDIFIALIREWIEITS